MIILLQFITLTLILLSNDHLHFLFGKMIK